MQISCGGRISSGEKFILAIDLGTSGPKVAVATVGGELLGSEFEETQLILLPDGGAEQSTADWWQAIDRAVKRLLGRNLAPSQDIVAIANTGQWSGTVPVDEAGEALSNAIIWMDALGVPFVQKIVDGALKVEEYALGAVNCRCAGKFGQKSDHAYPVPETHAS